MTKQEFDARMEHYRQALAAGRITQAEFQGFAAALLQILRGISQPRVAVDYFDSYGRPTTAFYD
jgi:hypothetical protein